MRGPLHAAGGGSRSDLWTRIRATVLGRPLRVAERAETAFGAALLAAAGTLHPDLSASARGMTAAGRPVDPVERERAALDESYDLVAQLRARGWLARAGTTQMRTARGTETLEGWGLHSEEADPCR